MKAYHTSIGGNQHFHPVQILGGGLCVCGVGVVWVWVWGGAVRARFIKLLTRLQILLLLIMYIMHAHNLPSPQRMRMVAHYHNKANTCSAYKAKNEVIVTTMLTVHTFKYTNVTCE